MTRRRVRLPRTDTGAGDRLFTIAPSPHSIFAYWRLEGALGKEAQRAARFRSHRWLLKLDGQGTARYVRVEVQAGKAYVPADSNTGYRVTLGFASSEGFFPVLEAPSLRTPASLPSPRTQPVWARPRRHRHQADQPLPTGEPSAPVELEAYLSSQEERYGLLATSGS